MSLKTLTTQILTKFPKNRISFCSAFVPCALQPVEVLFCVDDLERWHEENISMNPSHYSFMRFCGSKLITHMQMRGGANIYRHPPIQFGNGQFIRYETVSEDDFCYDLMNWTELHVSGHLHKPIQTIVAANSHEIASSIENNIQNAVRIALLILPEEFSYEDLFMEIALCSYDGKQFKPSWHKNREEIHKLVKPKLEEYFRFYLPHLKQHFSHCVKLPDPNEWSDGTIVQDNSTDMTRKHFYELPSGVLAELNELIDSEELTKEIISFYVEDRKALGSNLKAALVQTVGRTHRGQEAKDFMTFTLPIAIRKMFSAAAGRR